LIFIRSKRTAGRGWLSILFSGMVLFTLFSVLFACAGNNPDFDFGNMEYSIDITESGRAHLENGYYSESAAPQSASKIIVKLGDFKTYGDVNGNGSIDAAVILQAEGGGSGSFSYLVVLLNNAGSYKALDAVFLGDRIQVESLDITRKKIRVVLYDRGIGESMSVRPSLRKSIIFLISGDSLVEQE